MFDLHQGSSIKYNRSFIGRANSSSQCSAWTSFQSSLSSCSYSSLTISGSRHPTGITMTGRTDVFAIANALSTHTAFGTVYSNGYSWTVGFCGNGFELSATGSICTCYSGYSVRPCRGGSSWGGINGITCSAASQVMTVIFQ
jgi:hypothetical protein